jgi:hypothetical protein
VLPALWSGQRVTHEGSLKTSHLGSDSAGLARAQGCASPAGPRTATGSRKKWCTGGADKTWIYGGLRIRDGHAVTMSAERRNSLCYQQFLAQLEVDNPAGDIVVITDNLSSHTSVSTRDYLAEHPRIRQVFIRRTPAGSNARTGLMARPTARTLVADVSPAMTRRAATRQPRRHSHRDRGGHRAAQR